MSHLRLSVHHIQGVRNACADYISRNNFNDMIGARSEELANEGFSRMDVHPALNMTMISPLDALQQVLWSVSSELNLYSCAPLFLKIRYLKSQINKPRRIFRQGTST